MNGFGKVLLIGGGLAAFYLMRKHADKKFAEQAMATTQPQASPIVSAVESIKKLLPDDLISTPAPAPAPTPVQTTPVATTPIASPVLIKTTTPTGETTTTYIQPRLPTYSYPLNTLQRKTYSLDQRVLSIEGLNLR